MVEMTGIEPATPWMQIRCSPSWATSPRVASRHFKFQIWNFKPVRANLVAGTGFEPATFGLWAQRATWLLHPAISRSISNFKSEIWNARRAGVVGLGRLELPTSRLSGVRSNQLSYRPESLRNASHPACLIRTSLKDQFRLIPEN